MSSKQGKIKKNLGIGCIIASSFFLFNPDIAIIDIIPDVFGYLLLIAGLTQFAEVNEKIADARRGFQKAAICNAVKFSLIVVLFGLVTPRELPVSMLLFTFVMNMLDLIYIIPAYINLFGGFMYLGERLDGSFLLSRKRFIPRPEPSFSDERNLISFKRSEAKRKARCERAPSKTEKFQRVTLLFVIFKAVTPVLPEFTSLLNYEYSNSMINYYGFIPLYRAFAVIFMFVVGIIWLCRACRFYFGVRSDRSFMEAVKEKYSLEVLPNKVYFMKKYANLTKIIFSAAAFFLLNLYFDEVNIVPDIIAAVLFMIGAFYIKEYTDRWKLVLASGALLGISSVVTEALRMRFNSNFIKEQIMRNPDAYSAWERMFRVSVVEGICAALCVAALICAIWDITKRYSGFFKGKSDSFDPERATKELHSELLRPLILVGIFGVLASACVPLYFFGLSVRFEAVWFFDLLLSLLFAVLLTHYMTDITRNLNYTYFFGDE